MIKDKRYYINAFTKESDEGLQEFLLNGRDIDEYDENEFIASVEAIVGYYLESYCDNPLETWLVNLEFYRSRWKKEKEATFKHDEEVTRILKELQ